MTIERSHSDGSLTLCCNNCGEVEDTETNVFADAVAYMKSLSWRFKKDKDGDWEHYCKPCSRVHRG